MGSPTEAPICADGSINPAGSGARQLGSCRGTIEVGIGSKSDSSTTNAVNPKAVQQGQAGQGEDAEAA
eukprot:10108788-Prorocentrum_lima.AAC.1